jgi:hypothetical protein
LDFSFWGWMKEMEQGVEIWTRDGLFGLFLDGQFASQRVSGSCNKQRPLLTDGVA